jgi:TolB protein
MHKRTRRDPWSASIITMGVALLPPLLLLVWVMILSSRFAPSGNRLALTSTRDGNADIYVYDPQTRRDLKLTEHDATDIHPVWSPDGRQIAFVTNRASYQNAYNDVYVMNAFGGNQRNLTHNNANDNLPTWSPDGSRIAFVSNRNGSDEIFTLRADGSNLRRVTDAYYGEFTALNWSPDGTRLAFVTLPNNRRLRLLKLSNGAVDEIRLGAAMLDTMTWTHDGRGVIFSAQRFNNHDLYSYDFEAGSLTRLTTHPAIDYAPRIVPGRQEIVFASARSGGGDIYALDMRTGNVARLTNGAANEFYPALQP